MDSATRSSTVTINVEEEAAKRNTDCVYFLASPLTCKKGNECEYRHSEGARMNPRDCWFWLNGNCLNPKCSFRHPPLDGLRGTSAPLSAGLPASSMPVASSISAAGHPCSRPYAGNKQVVPCFYFQKGCCLKGDWCPFVHSTQPGGSVVLPQVQSSSAATTVTEQLQLADKINLSFPKGSNEQKLFQASQQVPGKAATEVKRSPKREVTSKKNAHIALLGNELAMSMPSSAPAINGNVRGVLQSRVTQQAEEHFQNGKEPDEFLAESSPGFDVLVDSDLADSKYYHNEDELERDLCLGDDPLGSMHETDYNCLSEGKFERDRYSDNDDSDQYGRVSSQYSWEHGRPPADRILEKMSVPSVKRSGLLISESSECMDQFDLRFRLSKQRRINGSRSSFDQSGGLSTRAERFIDDRRFGTRSRRGQRHLSSEKIARSRLKGRLKLPEKLSRDVNSEFHAGRELERKRNWGRLSSSRLAFSHQGRNLNDRIRRNRDQITSLDFEGPKSLAELKGAKLPNNNKEQHTRISCDTVKTTVQLEAEGSAPFEGPKPLSENFKEKWAVKSESENREDNSQRQRDNEPEAPSKMLSSTMCSHEEHKIALVSVVDEGGENISHTHQQIVHEIQSSNHEDDGAEIEVTEAMDVDCDACEQERCYKHDMTQGARAYDDNVGHEDEYLDDEDGDDFAKRISVMLS